MNYQEWLAEVPSSITDDVLWRTKVYQVALFLPISQELSHV